MEKKCKHCAMLIPKDAKICPYCRKKQHMSYAAKVVMIFIGLVVFYWLFIPSPYTTYKKRAEEAAKKHEEQSAANKTATPAAPVVIPEPSKDARSKQAYAIMDLVRQNATVYEEGDHLVVEFREYIYPYDINKRLKYVRAIADADAVIQGNTRLIFYYNPGGKLMAQAHPNSGVQLKN